MAIMLIFLWHAFWSTGGTTELSDDQKYLLGIALSLAGTVTGYYFGRVPAEKRAESAEKSEKAAKNEAAESNAKLIDTKGAEAVSNAKLTDAKKTVRRLIDGPASTEAVGIIADPAPPPSATVVRQELENLLERLD